MTTIFTALSTDNLDTDTVPADAAIVREYAEIELDKMVEAAAGSYPRFGFTTRDILEDEDAYRAWLEEILAEEYADFVAACEAILDTPAEAAKPLSFYADLRDGYCPSCGTRLTGYVCESCGTRIAPAPSAADFVNLTPHEVNIHLGSGEVISIPASGQLARVEQRRETLPPVLGVPVTRSTFGEIQGLPEPRKGTFFIVSGLVLARTTRADVFAPGEAIRDEAGRIVGCRGLSAANT